MKQYKVFFASVLILILIIGILFNFVQEVGKENKDFEVTFQNPDVDVKISSEEIVYERNNSNIFEQKAAKPAVETSTSTKVQSYMLELVNSGDTPGAAALKSELTGLSYDIEYIGSDFNESKDRSVVVYSVGLDQEALAISKVIGGALLSAYPQAEDKSPQITVYIGNDYSFE